LQLESDEPLSNLAFDFNWRRYNEAVAYGAAVQGAILSGVRDAQTSNLLLVGGCRSNR
jgi:hypothetical protein